MTSQRNALVMVDSFDMGGAESQAVLLARLLLEDGRYRVHMACMNRRGVLLKEAESLGLGEIPEYAPPSLRHLLTRLDSPSRHLLPLQARRQHR